LPWDEGKRRGKGNETPTPSTLLGNHEGKSQGHQLPNKRKIGKYIYNHEALRVSIATPS